MTSYYIAMLAGCFIVTWIPRIVPFLLSKKVSFPKWLSDFLSYLPLCILTALLFQSILEYRSGKLPLVNTLEFLACLPAFLVAARTKDLMKTVIVGIVSIALLRFFIG